MRLGRAIGSLDRSPRRPVSVTLGAVTFAAILVSAFSPLPNAVAAWIGVPSQIGPADAIVVLGAGGASGDGLPGSLSLRRTVLGVVLYRRGLAPLLVLSGTEEEIEARDRLAVELGVPDPVIITMTASTTRSEAARLREVTPPGVHAILLVTDTQHMSRAAPLFRQAGFTVRPAVVDDLPADARRPEARLGLTRAIAAEAMARLYHRIAGYL